MEESEMEEMFFLKTGKNWTFSQIQEIFARQANRSLSQPSAANGSLSSAPSTLYDIPLSGTIFLIMIYVIVALTAIAGNVIILFTIIKSKKLKGVTNYFIANLALADVMIGALAIPFNFQAALLQKWVLPPIMCSLCPFIQNLSLNVSIFTLVAIALDRFRAVIYPLRARTSHLKTKLCIIPIWLLSFILAAPTFVALKTRLRYNAAKDESVLICDMIGMAPNIWEIYNHILITVQYFIPLIIISLAYGFMGYKLYSNQDNNLDITEARSQSSSINENRKKVVKMMAIVVSLFGTCWFPFQLYNLLSILTPQINLYRYINLIWFSFHLLAMSNSCFNPFIYYFYSEVYNAEIKCHMSFLWCNKNSSRTSNSNISQSAARNNNDQSQMTLLTHSPRNLTTNTKITNTDNNQESTCL